ncbi:MAG: methyl-accepting chemotaxis protein [Pseudolabrys sp.]|jgi:methyl-accepting chemotaxis protein
MQKMPAGWTKPSTVQNSKGAQRPGWLSTIRSRLYLAFGFAAALTIIGSSVAFYEFTVIGLTTNEILSRSLPTTAVSLRLAEQASSLVSSAPRLMAASNDKIRSEIMDNIGQQEKKLENGIAHLRALGVKRADEIEVSSKALSERFHTLDAVITNRIIMSNERSYLASSVRAAHEALLIGLAPAIDDANFDLMMNAKQEGAAAVESRLESLRRLLETESESNLLAGLLTEASLVNDANRLEPLRDLIDSAQRKIAKNLAAISDNTHQGKLISLYKQLGAIGADDGIIAARAYELNQQQQALLAFGAAQSEASTLKSAVDELVEEQGHIAQEISSYASGQIRSGQLILIVLSIAAVIGATLVAWLYVGRSIARRLGLLSDAMRRIANGDFNVDIQDTRGDEIAEMGRTLLFFRQATADAASARRKESDQTRTLESRRQLVEGATTEFENAVSNIVKTLDRAAAAMDASAREMANSASHNQEQALATAAASEQATANVGIVATAAEEIAQSIEHIAGRVANSATVASQASGEAKAITDAVESLSASVDEIGEVSDLISSIAAQTNLLALNATIEAARAGDAGRGFAVVAQEVKGLATQTGKATEEITRHIVSIEQTTERSVQAIKKIAATIEQLSEVANDVAVAMRQQDSVTQEIARNAGAAAEGTRDVAGHITEVSNSAVKTGQVASTVLTAAAELGDQSHLLRQEVERYLTQLRVAS